jgi:hypothetical protein
LIEYHAVDVEPNEHFLGQKWFFFLLFWLWTKRFLWIDWCYMIDFWEVEKKDRRQFFYFFYFWLTLFVY